MPSMYLVPVAGPELEPIELPAEAAALTLGRHEDCQIALPADAEKVSRFHAKFTRDGDAWTIGDLNSRWGTFVNGLRIGGDRPTPLEDGDLVRITPWTFAFSATPSSRGLEIADDTSTTIVRPVSISPGDVRDELFTLLLDSATAIHAADSEAALAESVMESALRGTGLSNAMMLRPLNTAGRVEIIASKSLNAQSSNEPISFSRSLINLAATGQVAEMNAGAGGAGDNISQSIVQMRISAALCVPLMLGGAPAAFLYLDARHSIAQGLRPHASAFAVALGRMASLALANLKRVEMERRSATIEADLRAGTIAQKWVMPKRDGTIGGAKYIGESKPGRYVGGDFFDLIDLGNGRVAVALGDVAGKGVAASVLMTATQGFLHASLLNLIDPAAAVTATNRFVCPRRPESKFVTAWVGVFDFAAGMLTYIDAGHGYAVLRADGAITPLAEGGNVPIGVLDDHEYVASTVTLPKTGEVIVVSDGIVEQPGTILGTDGSLRNDMFEMSGVHATLSPLASDGDCVAALFAAVIGHAGTDQLADDATAVAVRW